MNVKQFNKRPLLYDIMNLKEYNMGKDIHKTWIDKNEPGQKYHLGNFQFNGLVGRSGTIMYNVNVLPSTRHL